MAVRITKLLEDDPDFDADEYMASAPHWADTLRSRGWTCTLNSDDVYFRRVCPYANSLYVISATQDILGYSMLVTVAASLKSSRGYDHLIACKYSEEEVIGVIDRIEGILDKMLPTDETRGLLLSLAHESVAQRAVSTLLEDDPDCDEIMFTPSNDHESIKAELEVKGWVINADAITLCDYKRDTRVSHKDCALRLILMKEPPHITCAEVRAWYIDSNDNEYSRLVPQGVDTWQMLADESAEEYVARIEADIRDYVVPEVDAEEGQGDYRPEPDFDAGDFMGDEG